jgi:hypothetical protein
MTVRSMRAAFTLIVLATSSVVTFRRPKRSSEPDFDAGDGAVPTIWLAIQMAADAQNFGQALLKRDRELRNLSLQVVLVK